MLPMERRGGAEDEPMAIRTKLGWTVFGKVCRGPSEFSLCIKSDDSDLSAKFDHYCTIEDFGVKSIEKLPKSEDEVRAENIIKDTIHY